MPKGLLKHVQVTFGSTLYQRPKKKITKANKNAREIEKERKAHIFELSGTSLYHLYDSYFLIVCDCKFLALPHARSCSLMTFWCLK